MLTKREKLRKKTKQLYNTLTHPRGTAVPVFVFGEMRSGTNMLTDCFDRCKRTTIFNETDDEVFEGYALRPIADIEPAILGAAGSHVVLKAIADSARAAELLGHFRNSRGIWIYRDYRDVVNSAMRKWTEHNKYLNYILSDPITAKWRSNNLPTELLELIEHHYSRGISDTSARALIWYFRNATYFHQELDAQQSVLLVNYENLVREPERQLSDVFDHVGLAFSQSYYRKVNTKSVGKEQAPAIDDEITHLCDEMFANLNHTLSAKTSAA